MLLIAGFQALFARLTGEDDLAVGTAIAGRGQVETEDLIGFFVNSLVLRGRLDGDPALPELLARVRATALGAYAHQDLPFERLVAELGVERSLSHAPLFQVMVTFQNTPQETLDLPGLRLSPADVPGETAKIGPDDHPLREWAGDRPGKRRLGVRDRSVRQHDRRTDGRRFRAPAGPPGWRRRPSGSRISLCSARPKRGRSPPGAVRQTAATAPACLHELFTAAARRHPGAVAVSSDGKTLTYGDLDQQSDRLARRLLGAGLGSGDAPVAICIDRSPEMLVGLLAILKTGRAYLPLDPDHPAERKAFILRDSRAGLLLTRRACRPVAAARGAGRLIEEESKGPEGLQGHKGHKGRRRAGDSAGSSGEPGLRHLHLGLDRQAKGRRCHPRQRRPAVRRDRAAGSASAADDVWTLFHSYAFDFSVWEMWGALLYGGRLVVVPYWVSRSPEEFLALLERERVTVLNQTPLRLPPAHRRPTSRLATGAAGAALVIFGGEALEPREPRALVRAPRRRPSAAGQHVRHHRDHRPRHLPADASRRPARPAAAA